jgi:hypothetical protein
MADIRTEGVSGGKPIKRQQQAPKISSGLAHEVEQTEHAASRALQKGQRKFKF